MVKIFQEIKQYFTKVFDILLKQAEKQIGFMNE